MEDATLILLIIIAMILLFALSNKENFIADIIQKSDFGSDSVKDIINQVKIKVITPILKPYQNGLASLPSLNRLTATNGKDSAQLTNSSTFIKADVSNNVSASDAIKTNNSNGIKLDVMQSQEKYDNLLAYNFDLDFESNANFGSQATVTNEFIKSNSQCKSGLLISESTSDWAKKNAEMHTKILNNKQDNIMGISNFDNNYMTDYNIL